MPLADITPIQYGTLGVPLDPFRAGGLVHSLGVNLAEGQAVPGPWTSFAVSGGMSHSTGGRLAWGLATSIAVHFWASSSVSFANQASAVGPVRLAVRKNDLALPGAFGVATAAGGNASPDEHRPAVVTVIGRATLEQGDYLSVWIFNDDGSANVRLQDTKLYVATTLPVI